MSEQTLEQLFNAGNFTEASAKLLAGEKLPKTLQPHQKSQILDNLFRGEQYEIILHLIKDKTIETDIYEFENFDRSVFQTVVRYLKTDENGLEFFKNFISKFDNLNDEVATQTLLGYFFEKLAAVELIKILVDAGCDVNFKTNAEENYIHLVVKNNQKRFDLNDNELDKLRKNYIELLINEGVEVDGENIVQKTPLIAAVEGNKSHLLSFLLEQGADPNHVDKTGNSAFYYAVANLQSMEMYNIMRAFALPQFDIVNKNQVTLLFEYTRMMYNSDSECAFLIKLLEDGADLYQPSIYYSTETTPLDLIVEKPASVLEAVLATGQVDVNRNDDKGNNILHKVCAQNVNYEPEKAKEMYRKVKLLIEHGADISATNDQDQTALMLASDDNLKIKTVELLMKNAQ
ncbi:ankyrin repeat domain-containing protein [Pedobacter frigidisoli]|uniref:Ankyrin repeat domain-containing protein n=1 Tax=Pedobacter frigidisoli TaxID=2530455 RepID=A0A4R0P327_9SPHI|nr:ankyrin repeat domain-containing protein [Pedobacter frigidisoli]TCD11254.1 ankyrin repeat domain-containing protein [Pedobacter frigidisoli]